MRLVVAIGARPNVVKVAPLLPEFDRVGIQTDLVFTGSRASSRSDDAGGALSFYGAELPTPRWFLDVGAGTNTLTTGRACAAFEELFDAERPDAVMVVGDVNATLAAAAAAAKARLPIVHLEAGTRCADMCVPEEVNRVLISRVAAMHLTPSEGALENLEDEGIEPERIHFVGSSVAEAVICTMDANPGLHAYADYDLVHRGYVLGSFHRRDNLGDRGRLGGLIAGLGRSPLPVLIPDTEGLRMALDDLDIGLPAAIRIIDAVPYRMMLALQKDAAAIITDSSGIQVEACMIGTQCVTVRCCTEHVTTLSPDANSLVEPQSEAIRTALVAAVSRRKTWVAPKRWDRAVSDWVARALKRGIIPLR